MPFNFESMGGGGGSNRWVLVAGDQPTSSNGWTTVGAAFIDPRKGRPVCTLRCVLEAGNGGGVLYPCAARLVNADENQAQVGGEAGELVAPQATPTPLSLSIEAGVTAYFPKAPRNYLLQIKMNGGGAPAKVSCKSACVEQS